MKQWSAGQGNLFSGKSFNIAFWWCSNDIRDSSDLTYIFESLIERCKHNTYNLSPERAACARIALLGYSPQTKYQLCTASTKGEQWMRRAVLDFEYSFHDKITSGALYHRVATYSVMNPTLSFTTRANPKSAILSKQSPLHKMLLGFWSLVSYIQQQAK